MSHDYAKKITSIFLEVDMSKRGKKRWDGVVRLSCGHERRLRDFVGLRVNDEVVCVECKRAGGGR